MFVREPVPGAVKTRLAAALGARGAADLYRAFVADTCARLAPEVPLALAPTPWVRNGFARTLARRHRLRLLPQGEGDLGGRMRRVAAAALVSAPRVVLLGSDAPTLPTAHVRAAVRALARARVVLGPSLDGGYHLLGVRAPLPDVFGRMRWSTDRVLARTLARLRRARIAPALVPCWYDVDTLADVALLARHLAVLAALGESPCPRTRRVLARLTGGRTRAIRPERPRIARA
jgi:rSAM/selenodomain-associated transferase 1